MTITLQDWRQTSRQEPTLRVGVILDQDRADAIRIDLAGAYALSRPAAASVRLTAGARLVARRGPGGALLASAGAEELPPANILSLAPAGDPAAPHACARDVVAGRGFHWQTRVDPWLPGALELRAGPNGLELINELGLEPYLAGVITAEMSGACPREFLKAQCVVARSWLLAMSEPKHAGEPFDRCNDDCCQRYQGLADLSDGAREAMRSTRGLVLLDGTEAVLDANYSKSCGGVSELAEHVWGAPKAGISAVVDAPAGAAEHAFLPVTEQNLAEYLDGAWVADARAFCSPSAAPLEAIGRYLGRVDEVDNYFRWSVTHGLEALEALLAAYAPPGGAARLRDLHVTKRGVSGRASELALSWQTGRGEVAETRITSEYALRAALHPRFLYSSAFRIGTERDPDGALRRVTLRGAGWGHGVGMCQIGALGMSLQGVDWRSICRHYYPRASIEKVY